MRLTLAPWLLLALVACADDEPLDTADTGDDGPNNPPTAVDDTATGRAGQSITIAPLTNDDDPDGDRLRISEIVQPDNGFVEIINAERELRYTPTDAEWTGVDSFEYTTFDGNGGEDSATVSVNVTPAPTLLITSPDDGVTLTGPEIDMSFEVTGCTPSSPSSNPTECHLHRYVDGSGYTDLSGQGATGWYQSADMTWELAPGTYELMLRLHENDGTDAAIEPEVTDTITITVVAPD